MKKILFFVLCLLCIGGDCDRSLDPQKRQNYSGGFGRAGYSIDVVEVDQHEYIIINTNNGCAICHSLGCKYCKAR